MINILIKELQLLIIEIRNFSLGNISESEFNLFINKIKHRLAQFNPELNNEEQKTQFYQIIHFQTVSQCSQIKQVFIQFLAPDKYRWPMSSWKNKGKYVYDLDQLELKVSGLVYKLEQQ